MLISTSDFYLFISLSVTITLVWGYKISRRQYLSASFCRAFFQPIRTKFCMVLEQFKLNILSLFWMRFNVIREIIAVLLAAYKKPLTLACIQTFMNSLVQTWYVDRYCCILHLDTSLSDLDLHSRSQECERKQKLLLQLSYKVVDQIGWHLVYHWDTLAWWTTWYSFYLT